MGLLDWLFGDRRGAGVEQLASRLGIADPRKLDVRPSYRPFQIPKRSGGVRTILAPSVELKKLQRHILHGLLAKLQVHPAVHGFERHRSILTNAAPHAGSAVVVRLDIRDFFSSTRADRIRKYFRKIGWNREAAELLTRLTTYDGGLPQGAPSSPRLANLVNHRLDARLAALAAKLPGKVRCREEVTITYTRYADDLTFSFSHDLQALIADLLHYVAGIVQDEGYRLHTRRKLQIRRRHQRQSVTGLVVNETPNLPRAKRRWLRAVEHHLATKRRASLTAEQLAGWRAFRHMLRSPEA
jgi:hypothetical protein